MPDPRPVGEVAGELRGDAVPRFQRSDGAATDDEVAVRSLLVPALPPCVPRPEESIYTSNGIEPR